MSKICDFPPATKPLSSTTSQLNGKFNSLYLQKETWYRKSDKRVDN